MCLTVLILLLTWSSTAKAQQQKGDREIFASFSINVPEKGDGTATGVLKYGQYQTDNINAGLLTITSFSKNFSSLSMGIYGGYSLLMGTKYVPYANALIIYTTTNTDVPGGTSVSTNTGLVGGEAGVKYYFAEYAAVDFSAQYQTQLFGDKGSGSLMRYLIGISVLLPRKDRK